MKQPLGDLPGGLFLPVEQLEQLYQQLQQAGYGVLAPRVVEGAILYREVDSFGALPQGITDQQQPGRYRLQANSATRYFSWSSGAESPKSYLFPPQQPLWRSVREHDGTLRFDRLPEPEGAIALFGVRPCDLAAIGRLDRHLLRAGAEDPWYRARRENTLLITVSCHQAAETCFCVSTATGPAAEQGFDLRLDELDDGFLLWSGSTQGEKIAVALQLSSATSEQLQQGRQQIEQVVERQQRQITADDFRPHFSGAEDSPLWQQIAERCLGCGNCTAVCPTCFCHREEEVASLDLQQSTHQRVWDSCFSDEHSQLHGVPIRSGRRERYRQWMTHKLAGWHDQFGESGCVGCGRCITWCPVGIDLVAESARFSGVSRDQ